MEGRRRKKGERDLGTKIFILDLKMRTLLFATTINLTSLLLLFLFFYEFPKNHHLYSCPLPLLI